MTAQQMNVDNIAHNLANANTSGFKARRAQFQDLMYQAWSTRLRQPGSKPLCQLVCSWDWELTTSSNEVLLQRVVLEDRRSLLNMIPERGFRSGGPLEGEIGLCLTFGAFLTSRPGRQPGDSGRQPLVQITAPSAAALQISIGQDGTVSYSARSIARQAC